MEISANRFFLSFSFFVVKKGVIATLNVLCLCSLQEKAILLEEKALFREWSEARVRVGIEESDQE